MEKAVTEMENQGVQSYILDLRNNPASFSLFLSLFTRPFRSVTRSFLIQVSLQGGLVKAGLDVAQIWLDGDETLVNTIDRDGNMLPINMVNGHAKTHDPLVVLVSLVHIILFFCLESYYSLYLLSCFK